MLSMMLILQTHTIHWYLLLKLQIPLLPSSRQHYLWRLNAIFSDVRVQTLQTDWQTLEWNLNTF